MLEIHSHWINHLEK